MVKERLNEAVSHPTMSACPHCHHPLIEIDHSGERLIGCIECNRWGRLSDLIPVTIPALRLLRTVGSKNMKQLMVVIIAVLVPAAAMAKDACKADREKFCKDVIVAKGNVGACLKQHQGSLSEACKTQREAFGQCKADKEKFCEDAAYVFVCLAEHVSELSEACKNKLQAMANEKKDKGSTSKEGGTHAQSGAQPLTKEGCKKAGRKWNDQSNVCV